MDANDKPRSLYPLKFLELPALLPLDPVEPVPAEVEPGWRRTGTETWTTR